MDDDELEQWAGLDTRLGNAISLSCELWFTHRVSTIFYGYAEALALRAAATHEAPSKKGEDEESEDQSKEGD